MPESFDGTWNHLKVNTKGWRVNHKPSQVCQTKKFYASKHRWWVYHDWFIVSRTKVLRVGEDVPRGTFLKKVLTLVGELVVFGHVLLGPSQPKYPIVST